MRVEVVGNSLKFYLGNVITQEIGNLIESYHNTIVKDSDLVFVN